MTAPAVVRRLSARGLFGALVATGALLAVPTGPALQAVISYDGQLAAVPGMQVLASFPSLRMAVVRADAGTLSRLASAPGIRGVAPDDVVQLAGHDDDGGAGAVLASEQLGGQAGLPGAGAGIRVAVVDTGVSDTAALNRASGRLVDAADASRVGDGGGLETGGTYTDVYGHGTFMADVIAGGAVNGTGGKAIGVAPGATVLVVRVARRDGSTSLSKVLAGLDWIAAHSSSVDVVNLSLSHSRPGSAYGADPLTDAVDRVRAAGVAVVVSSGNTKKTVSDPGFDPKALTVGAADLETGRVASFSGSDVVAGVAKPDVVASGVDVLGLLPPNSVLATSSATQHLADGLFRGSGTSQAAAITSGVAALFLAAHHDATPAQVKASLRCAASGLPGHRDGAGLLRTTTTVCAGADGNALDGSGDATGESTFDASSWGASSWGASSWAASSWGASSWAASSWAGTEWGAP